MLCKKMAISYLQNMFNTICIEKTQSCQPCQFPTLISLTGHRETINVYKLLVLLFFLIEDDTNHRQTWNLSKSLHRQGFKRANSTQKCVNLIKCAISPKSVNDSKIQ